MIRLAREIKAAATAGIIILPILSPDLQDECLKFQQCGYLARMDFFEQVWL